jgi:aspartyl-tRNA(Asn)/glutamyl-tRNA(Gln) amidotransferase subunit B
MKFGVFDHMDDSGVPLEQHYENRLRLIEAYDRAGMYGYHVAEHHGTPLGVATSPGIFLAAVAQRTKRLRFGPLVYLLPFYHPLRLIEEIWGGLPELPDAKRARFVADYGLSVDDASVLVAERATADYFETVAHGRDPKSAANWVIHELFGLLNRAGKGIETSPVKAHQLGRLLDLMADGTISGRIAKDVFAEMFETGQDPGIIVEAKGLKQVSDAGAIEAVVDRVVAANPTQVEQYRFGNAKVIGWLVGQVMKATQGKANPKLVNDVLKRRLEG